MSLLWFFWLTVALVLALACTGMPRRAAKTAIVLWFLLLAVLGLIA